MASFDLEIMDCRMVTPSGMVRGNILVKDGVIAAISKIDYSAERIIDARDFIVIPGSVDPHVHMMDPGHRGREDFITGTTAAAMGGVTTIIEHHRTKPFVMNAKILRDKAEYLKPKALVDFGLFGGADPRNLDELEPMWKTGALAFKAFTCDLHGARALLSDDMLKAFQAIARFDGLCLVHAEDESITASNEERLKKEGRKDYASTSEWRSKEAEEVAVGTVVNLAWITGARVVVAHVSHPKVLDIINDAKKRGAKVWVESCPQYFFLTDEDVTKMGPWCKFTPPARDSDSRDGMWVRLRAGEIDMIDADHAPATKKEKEKGLEDIWKAPFGIPGIETKLPLLLTAVNQGRINLQAVVELTATNPARVYGLFPKKGVIQVGSDADLVLVDMNRKQRLSNDIVTSKCGWTPYDGLGLQGLPVATLIRGEIVMLNREIVAKPGRGRYIPRSEADSSAYQ